MKKKLIKNHELIAPTKLSRYSKYWTTSAPKGVNDFYTTWSGKIIDKSIVDTIKVNVKDESNNKR